jgi:hypothetical protein
MDKPLPFLVASRVLLGPLSRTGFRTPTTKLGISDSATFFCALAGYVAGLGTVLAPLLLVAPGLSNMQLYMLMAVLIPACPLITAFVAYATYCWLLRVRRVAP